MKTVIVVCGPTASGKTSLSIKLAKHFNTEIVSADSMQIYKEMQIGTAKPDMTERENIPHHMMDVISVCDEYNVSRYKKDAESCIDKIHENSDYAVVVGGTGLYIDSLVNNVEFFEIDNDFSYRDSLMELSETRGGAYLREMLFEVDPTTAARLHDNDLKRIIRALEVFHVTGKPLSHFQRESLRERKYNVIFIGINFKDRSILYDRIDRRVDVMIDGGLVEEAKKIMDWDLSKTARAAIGYSDIFDYLNGKLTLKEAADNIKQKSRRYAKRQITWFKRNEEIEWLYPDEADEAEMLDKALSFIKSKTEDDIET